METELNAGYDVDLKRRRLTFQQWAGQWKQGQRVNRQGTVSSVESDLKRLNKTFGDRPLRAITVSEIKSWVAAMTTEGLKQSTVHAKYRRMAQIMGAAVEEDLVRKSPCVRSNAPSAGKRDQQIPTTEQVWDLYGKVPEGLKAGILLGAFVGLRSGEAVALRVEDVDFMGGEVQPVLQHKDQELKTESSKWAVPIPQELALELSKYAHRQPSDTLVQSALGQKATANTLQVGVKAAADELKLYRAFRFHDLRHFYASLLISEGIDVVTVSKCMRHAKPATTLRVYAHWFPDVDEAPRAAVKNLFAARGAANVA